MKGKGAVCNPQGRRSDDMDVAYISGHDLYARLSFQPCGKVSCPGSEVENRPFLRQPVTNLVEQLARASLHDGVKQRLQQHSARASLRLCMVSILLRGARA